MSKSLTRNINYYGILNIAGELLTQTLKGRDNRRDEGKVPYIEREAIDFF